MKVVVSIAKNSFLQITAAARFMPRCSNISPARFSPMGKFGLDTDGVIAC